MALTRNIIVVSQLIVLSAVVEGSRLLAATSLHTQAGVQSHARSHAKRAFGKLREPASDEDDDDGAGASDEDSGASDDDDDNAANNAELAEAQDALHDAQWKQGKNAAELDSFKDGNTFKKEIAVEVKVVSNETQSPGLAKFLGEIRDEMRTYAVPSYSAHLEHQQKKLEHEVKFLDAKLAALENKSVAATGPENNATKTPLVSVDSSKALAADEVEIKELKEKAKGSTNEAGHVFAFAFLGTVTMLSAVFAMANSGDDTVKNYTWFLLDQVTAIFLAVMYFQAFDDLLDFMDFGGTHLVLSAVVHALVMFSLALVLAVMLRGQEVGLAILCGAGAHVTSFTSIHAAAVVQNNVWLKVDFAWVWCLVGLVVLAFVLAAIGAAVYKAKQFSGVSRDDGFMDKTDDMENDFGAMAFSVCWSMFIRFLITGHHPVDDDTEFDHTPFDRHCMLASGIFSLVVACFAVPFCSGSSSSYPVKRFKNFVSSVCAMNVAWSFFFWAEWELFETAFAGQPIFGRIAFALLATVLGGVGILALAKAPIREGRVQKVALTALGLMVAWSWELCFDAAIDDMCEGRDHPAMYKIASTAFMFVVVIPVYGIYMKPISMPAAEAIGA